MFTNILVPLDGSQLAEMALPHALHLARIFQSRLVLLHVLEAAPDAERGELIEPLSWQIRKAEADLYLRGLVTRLGESGQSVDYQILEGRTPDSIVQYAQTNEISLVVLSSHGKSGLSRWNISSVVAKVIEKIYLPVLVVRAYQALESTAAEVAYRKILLPFDLSKRAECSLPVGMTIAQADAGEILLAHVLKRPEVITGVPESAEITRLADEFVNLSQAASSAYMEEMCVRVPVPCSVRLVVGDSIPRALDEIAEQENADLLIFCAHGQSGQADWPYGSVSRHYIEQGAQAVLVLQDIPPHLVKPTRVEIAASRYGSRG